MFPGKSRNSPQHHFLVAEDISPALGCYGDDLATTPNIDAMAARVIVYDNAFATAPICAPSRSCLMSGLYAASLGTQHLRCEIPFSEKLHALLDDSSPSVAICAAEVLCHFSDYPQAVNTLGAWVQDERPWLAMQAARSIQLIGDDARPLIPVIYQVLYKNLNDGTGAHRKYKDFNYAAFASWALEWALQELGEKIKVN